MDEVTLHHPINPTPESVTLQDCMLRGTSGRIRLDLTSLEFAPGMVTAVIGPNGAGKSTLMGLASATLRPSEGRVLFGEVSAADLNARELAQRRAVLAQELSVPFGFSVHDVVSWGRTPWRGTKKQQHDSAVVAGALDSLQISGIANRPINELSGGERKRVHLARITAQETTCVFMDEPDADLDLSGLAILDSTIRRMNDQGATVVISTHDIQRASHLADRIVLVAQQKVLAHGETRLVLNSDVLSEAYKARVEIEWGDRGVTHISIRA